MFFLPGSPEDLIYRDYAQRLGHTTEVPSPMRVTLSDLANRYDGIFLDSYGVLNRAGESLPMAAEGVAWLKSQGKIVRVLTNNAALSEEENRKHLNHLGIPLEAGDVICSGSLLAKCVKDHGIEGPVFFLGLPGARTYLQMAGLEETPDPAKASAVILASTRGYRMRRIGQALQALQGGKTPLIVLNPDAVAPREGGHMFRVSGVTARSLHARTGCPVHLLGKPFPEMYALAMERTGLTADRCLMIGDTLATDILGARTAGFGAALVLTGVTPEATALTQAKEQRLWPDFLLPDLSPP
jgi:HAD superfamily hydrolase (TIGR01450 family)